MKKWGIVGLVHDLDWDQFPEEHCKKTKRGELISETILGMREIAEELGLKGQY